MRTTFSRMIGLSVLLAPFFVFAAGGSPTCQVTFDKNPISNGESTVVHWTSTNAESLYVNSIGYVAASGSTTVSPHQPTDYSGIVTGTDGTTVTCAASLGVNTVCANACPAGFFLNGKTCVCPAGQEQDNVTGMCVPTNGIVLLAPSIINWKTSVSITWSARDATSCTGEGFDTGGATSGSFTTGPILQTTTFTLTCDTGAKSITVAVPACPTGFDGTPPVCTRPQDVCPIGYVGVKPNCVVANSCPIGYAGTPPDCVCTPTPVCFENNVINSCTGEIIQDCAAPRQCVNGACVVPAPTVAEWRVEPLLVKAGKTVKLWWNVINATSCTVSGTNGDAWGVLNGQDIVSGPIHKQAVFTLHCTPLSGSSASDVNRTATVNIVPVFIEK